MINVLILSSKRALVGLALLLSVGCTSVDMPKAASALEATKDLWRAACTHEPVTVPAATCSAAHEGINALIDGYTAANSELSE